MNIPSLFAGIAKSPKMLSAMHEAWKMAQDIQQTRKGILEYVQKNNARISEMLPYLNKGAPVRTMLDNLMPGMAPKLQAFGQELVNEQPSTNSQSITPNDTNIATTLGNRFPALKPKR